MLSNYSFVRWLRRKYSAHTHTTNTISWVTLVTRAVKWSFSVGTVGINMTVVDVCGTFFNVWNWTAYYLNKGYLWNSRKFKFVPETCLSEAVSSHQEVISSANWTNDSVPGQGIIERSICRIHYFSIISLREYLAAARTLMHNITSSLVYFLRSRESPLSSARDLWIRWYGLQQLHLNKNYFMQRKSILFAFLAVVLQTQAKKIGPRPCFKTVKWIRSFTSVVSLFI